MTARQPAATAMGRAPLLIMLNIILIAPLPFLTAMAILPSRLPVLCISRCRAPLLSLCMSEKLGQIIKLEVASLLTAQLLLETPRPMAPLLVSMTSKFWEAQVVELQAQLIGIPQTAPSALGRMTTAIITYVMTVFSIESVSWTWWLLRTPPPRVIVGPVLPPPPGLPPTVYCFFLGRFTLIDGLVDCVSCRLLLPWRRLFQGLLYLLDGHIGLVG